MHRDACSGLMVSAPWREPEGTTSVVDTRRRKPDAEPAVRIVQTSKYSSSLVELSPDGARNVIRELQEWLSLVDSGTL